MEKKLIIINQINEIEKLEPFMEELLLEEIIPLKLRFNLNLILEEILTNIIFYGYEDSNEHLINITVLSENNELKIIIQDDGIPFNPLETPEPDLDKPLEEREIGGMGIHLVKNLSDSIDYSRDNCNNVLSIKMRVSSKEI